MARPRTYCTVRGCDKPNQARGLCALHYHRWRVHGDPLACRRPSVGKAEAFRRQAMLANTDACIP